MEAIEIRRVCVLGAGQMGLGIAQVCAGAGVEVMLSDVDRATARRGLTRLREGLERRVARGKLLAEQAENLLGRITTVDAPAGEVDMAIEAASESRDLKLEIFRQLDRALHPRALLCSNTSSISISAIASATHRPTQVAGLHFMNPVPVMELVELVTGMQTSAQTLSTLRAFVARLGKTNVLSQDRPGFIVNRVLIPMLNEACLALQEGVASASDIDAGVRLGLNHPMGPLELSDLIGLDTVLAIAMVLREEIGDDKYRPASLLRNLVASGWLGKKSGRGFYQYDDAGRPTGANPAL